MNKGIKRISVLVLTLIFTLGLIQVPAIDSTNNIEAKKTKITIKRYKNKKIKTKTIKKYYPKMSGLFAPKSHTIQKKTTKYYKYNKKGQIKYQKNTVTNYYLDGIGKTKEKKIYSNFRKINGKRRAGKIKILYYQDSMKKPMYTTIKTYNVKKKKFVTKTNNPYA